MSVCRPINRRVLIASAAAVAGSGGLALGGATEPNAGRLTCADALDVLGVNMHLGYEGSPYADVGRVRAAIDLLGVRHARDGMINMAGASSRRYASLAEHGVDFCMVASPHRRIDDQLGDTAAFEAAHPGAVRALEGPNEIKPDFPFAGLTGTEAAVRYMVDLRAAAGRAGLGAKPLVAFTGYARAASDSDFANVHLYPRGGADPGRLFAQVRERWSGPNGVIPGKPLVVTEMGFHTFVGPPARPGDWPGVDENTQAILAINAWIAAASAGVTKLYLYELLDEGPDRLGVRGQQSRFGLFRPDGAPKPAATALGALSLLLRGGGRKVGPSARAPSDIRVSAPEGLVWLPLAAADGTTLLLFRNTAPVWEAGRGAPADPSALIATITLSRPAPLAAWELSPNRLYTDVTASGSWTFKVGRIPIAVRVG